MAESWCTNEKKLMIDYQEFFLIQMMCLFIKYKNAQCIYMHAQSSVNSIHIILKMRLYLKKINISESYMEYGMCHTIQ